MRFHPACLVVALVISVSGAGCTGSNGHLQVKGTDAPGNIDDFSSVMVTMDAIKVHKSGAAGDSDSEGNESGAGWKRFESDKTFDLRSLLEGNTTELVNASLEAGKYTQIRLVVSKAEGTLKDGSKIAITVPSHTLKIVKPFDVASGKTTTFVADINVVKDGDGYKLTPVVGKSMTMGPA